MPDPYKVPLDSISNFSDPQADRIKELEQELADEYSADKEIQAQVEKMQVALDAAEARNEALVQGIMEARNELERAGVSYRKVPQYVFKTAQILDAALAQAAPKST